MKRTINFILYPIIIGFLLTLTTSCNKDDNNPEPTTVTDIDGNVYNTVKIGTQVWMVENLKVTKFRNGESIQNVTDAGEWSALTTGAYCDYNNDENNSSTYGRLYNWYSVNDTRNIAPTGWHIPTDADYFTLAKYIDASAQLTIGIESSNAGGKLKEIGFTHWASPNTSATDDYGFTGLPGGARTNFGDFVNITIKGYYWTISEDDISSEPWYRNLLNDGETLRRYTSNINSGFSVRCVKD